MKIFTIIGARPQFVKAAVVSRYLAEKESRIEEVIVHTGQHYDSNMSDVFFEQLSIPKPKYHLGIGGGSHGQNTGRMIEELERILILENPDFVIVYGDTDSTLAGAIAAVKLQIPIAHVEAGLRSYNRAMPEEINRILTDHASDLLLTPTKTADLNLGNEGVETTKYCFVGDVMLDATLFYSKRMKDDTLSKLGIAAHEYYLITIHRKENTDDRNRLLEIVQAMDSSNRPIVFPLHPRTKARLNEFGIDLPDSVITIPPVGYLEMLELEKNSRCIITDSGGVQKEAFFLEVPCLTVRTETEWTELIHRGANRLVEPKDLIGYLQGENSLPKVFFTTDLFGDGNAAQKIIEAIKDYLR